MARHLGEDFLASVSVVTGPSRSDDVLNDVDLDFNERMSLYQAAEVRVVIDGIERSPREAANVLGVPLMIITAANPKTQRWTKERNDEANRLLKVELDQRGLDAWSAVGRDPDPLVGHEEWGFAVRGLPLEDARAIGTSFGQDAIFVVEANRLGIATCDTDATTWLEFS